MKEFLLSEWRVGGTRADMRAAVRRILDAGGQLLKLAPMNRGWVVACPDALAVDLNLLEWR